MEAIQKVVNDVEELERRFADEVARLALELEPNPKARNAEALTEAWTRVSFTRGKLARFIRSGFREIHDCSATDSLQRRQLRLARKRMKAMKTRLGLWTRLSPAVTAQLQSKRRDLTENDFRSAIDLNILDHVMNLFFASMHRLANPNAQTQSDAAISLGCHRDIPLPMDRFCQLIGAAHRVCLALNRQRPLRFLDVGSGGGTKVLAATTCFEICDGLEYDEHTVAEGRRFLEILQADRCRLIHGDALRFSDYGSYDVIYFYRPLKKSSLNTEMEKRIISQVKPGTILLNAGGTCLDDLPARGIHELVYQVFVTGKTKDEAAELLDIAEHKGAMVPQFRSEPLTGQDYWSPLLEVSERNGYFI